MKRWVIIPVLFLVGCAGLQRGIDQTNDYLNRPVSTQPGAPTNAQVITAITPAASAAAGPWAPLVEGLVVGSIVLLHNLDSRRRQAKLKEELKK
jgi:hypothetical protein